MILARRKDNQQWQVISSRTTDHPLPDPDGAWSELLIIDVEALTVERLTVVPAAWAPVEPA